ncbi:MAG: hypothetical protein AAF823_02425 [Planctomycetota bacterium]
MVVNDVRVAIAVDGNILDSKVTIDGINSDATADGAAYVVEFRVDDGDLAWERVALTIDSGGNLTDDRDRLNLGGARILDGHGLAVDEHAHAAWVLIDQFDVFEIELLRILRGLHAGRKPDDLDVFDNRRSAVAMADAQARMPIDIPEVFSNRVTHGAEVIHGVVDADRSRLTVGHLRSNIGNVAIE